MGFNKLPKDKNDYEYLYNIKKIIEATDSFNHYNTQLLNGLSSLSQSYIDYKNLIDRYNKYFKILTRDASASIIIEESEDYNYYLNLLMCVVHQTYIFTSEHFKIKKKKNENIKIKNMLLPYSKFDLFINSHLIATFILIILMYFLIAILTFIHSLIAPIDKFISLFLIIIAIFVLGITIFYKKEMSQQEKEAKDYKYKHSLTDTPLKSELLTNKNIKFYIYIIIVLLIHLFKPPKAITEILEYIKEFF